ncbi:hypothetical protein [Kutzneria albida]|uniref:Uncharacterized protein n=1 Tax=Kutzneria albida DSM 43870 TaxID=1449976 RepID=W5WCP7_9PSEU|nr:hypothetical protein [Kutzneria albida]AHH98326.1 hypothetical protein KALB_4964 [Kutzneria albida DSM 43870]
MSPINEGASSSVTAELFRASGLTLTGAGSDTVTAGTVNLVTGVAGPIDISQVSNGLLVVNVANAPTGTTPGLAVFFDVRDGNGNWVLVSNPTAISGAVLTTSGTVWGNISNGYQLTALGRIRWGLTGTTPSFTGVSFSLWGR